jgi:hypothetical protein
LVVGDQAGAIQAFESLLRQDPIDHEARVLLAEQLTQRGDKALAAQHYRFIVGTSPQFDPAKRALGYLDFQQANQHYQASGRESLLWLKLQARGQGRVREAKALLAPFYQARGMPERIALMERIKYQFLPTQSVRQMANLAEFDAQQQAVRFAPELAFADPAVVAAYMAHELVHAADGDGLTSILEEQDGYRELAMFWQGQNHGVIEPNLDLALSLYNESADKLDQKVRELYAMRDPLILEKSPGHGLPRQVPATQSLEGMRLYNQANEMERTAKYTQWVYDRVKTLMIGH